MEMALHTSVTWVSIAQRLTSLLKQPVETTISETKATDTEIAKPVKTQSSKFYNKNKNNWLWIFKVNDNDVVYFVQNVLD